MASTHYQSETPSQEIDHVQENEPLLSIQYSVNDQRSSEYYPSDGGDESTSSIILTQSGSYIHVQAEQPSGKTT